MGGAGGASMPAPNVGHLASGRVFVQQATKMLEKALPMVGAESDIGQAVIKAIQNLTKFTGPEASPQMQQTGLQQLMMSAKQGQQQPQGGA